MFSFYLFLFLDLREAISLELVRMIYISIEYPLQLHKQETKEVAQTDNEKIGKKGRKKRHRPILRSIEGFHNAHRSL